MNINLDKIEAKDVADELMAQIPPGWGAVILFGPKGKVTDLAYAANVSHSAAINAMKETIKALGAHAQHESQTQQNN